LTTRKIPGSQTMSYETTRFNALRHGVLSKHTVLPWEDEAEYETLLQSLVDEYHPEGPTEEHLVEELAGAIWRKRRLRVGEKAAHTRALQRTTQPDEFPETSRAALVLITHNYRGRVPGEAVSATDGQPAAVITALEKEENRILRLLQVIKKRTPGTELNAYEDGFALLNHDERRFWLNRNELLPIRVLSENKKYSDTASGLADFVETEILPRYRDRRLALENRELIREQSFGEAVNTPALDGFSRYEIHLDRKFERTLAMLLKLKNLRRDADE
jgi:hypothetical protein